MHTHLHPASLASALALLDRHGVGHAVNVSGSSPGRGLEVQIEAARLIGRGRVSVFCNLDWGLARRRPDFAAEMARSLEQARVLGAIGLKISKGLGLGYEDATGRLIAPDSPALDAVFRRAGELGLPVLVHVGDPKAFWLPPSPSNERWDELRVHPGWSYFGEPVPSWQALFDAFERLVARHPKTIFIGAHFGNDPEDPPRVGAMLDRYPNLYIDTAARVPEIGRRPAAEMRAFFVKHQDRVLFGTDLGVGLEPADLMFGSSGADPPTAADEARFYESTWRYFETADRAFDHPTPIQGRWKIDGIALPREVLEKLYWRNAARLLGLRPPPAVPAQ